MVKMWSNRDVVMRHFVTDVTKLLITNLNIIGNQIFNSCANLMKVLQKLTFRPYRLPIE